MTSAFAKILLITKEGHEQAKELAGTVRSWLQKQGIDSVIWPNERGNDFPLDSFSADLVLVLGGDGTILSVARNLDLSSRIPLLGLNLGRVGFLTELSPQRWGEDLDRILRGDFILSSQIVLSYFLERDGEIIRSGKVINDLVVGRSGLARLIGMTLWYGSEELGELRADGMIISTPIGTTAYAAAAGGALLTPDLRAMEVCPVSPFLSRFPPLILGSDQTLTIEVAQNSSKAILTLDGQVGFGMQGGDRVHVKEADIPLYFVRLPSGSYIQKLRSRGYLT